MPYLSALEIYEFLTLKRYTNPRLLYFTLLNSSFCRSFPTLYAADAERERGVYSPQYNNTDVKTDRIKTQSGGLPERHKAHLSWPPIVTKNNNTKPIYCKVQGAKGTNVHKS